MCQWSYPFLYLPHDMHTSCTWHAHLPCGRFSPGKCGRSFRTVSSSCTLRELPHRYHTFIVSKCGIFLCNNMISTFFAKLKKKKIQKYFFNRVCVRFIIPWGHSLRFYKLFYGPHILVWSVVYWTSSNHFLALAMRPGITLLPAVHQMGYESLCPMELLCKS